MIRNRAASIAAASALVLGSCSGGGSDGPAAGTCDWTGVAEHRTCLEQSGNAALVADQRTACESNAGTWTAEPCPVNGDLIGCCSYVFELSFRECFYARPERAYDPESVCTQSTWEGVAGVWTPAPPPP